MADFPSKVNTETSSQPQGSQGGRGLRGLAESVTTRIDMPFARSIPAVLMMAEIFLGLLQWALIASTPYMVSVPVYGWVMFVAVTLWILTIILFFAILFGVHLRLPAVPWPLVVMVYHGVATVLSLTAFISNAANVHLSYHYGYLATAAAFSAGVTLTYGASACFSYLEWREDGGNAATHTVPT